MSWKGAECMPDFALLEKLCLATGVSGREEDVRALILEEVASCTDSCETDALGNLIVFKRGAKRPAKKLMLSAHMDEVGFIVTGATGEGLLRFATVGGIDEKVLCGKSVTVGDRKLPGVIGARPIHLLKSDEREKAVPVEELTIDIGAKDREEALAAVFPGDTVCFVPNFIRSGKCILSKALDDRAGCAVLIELLRRELPFDMTFVFCVQEEIGLRGAKTAAYAVNPEAAIVVETTTAADVSGVEEEKEVCRVGSGAVVSFMDRSTIYDPVYYRLALEAGREAGVKTQLKQATAGGNDAGAIHVSRAGVRTAAVSLPCRYLHSATGLISAEDYDAVRETVWETARRIAGGEAE